MILCLHKLPYVYNSHGMVTTEVSIYWWMGKEDMIHKYSGIVLSHLKG